MNEETADSKPGPLRSVTCLGQEYGLKPIVLCHAADKSNIILHHNAFNHQGLVWSTSIFNRTQGIESITPYYLKAQSDPKEAVWEQVRKDHFPLLPSRQGAFFLFKSESVARKRFAEWFPGQDRWFLRSQIVEGSGVMVADARWLNCQQQDWEKNAREYWAGNETSDPQREILVDGGVYFLDWRAEPFGFFRPQA